jgi:ketosteroid isomerase-like protein
MNIEERLASLEKKVFELEAYEGIRDAIASYSWAVDTEDWKLMEDTFTVDAVCENKWRGKNYIGNKAIADFFRQHRTRFHFSNRMSNLNERIKVKGKTAAAKSYFLVMYTLDGESRIGWGYYNWELRYEKNTWKISRLVLEPTLMSTIQRGWGMETDRVLEAPPLEEKKQA